jgi:hypothetical protein
MNQSKNYPTFRPVTDQAFPAPESKPQGRPESMRKQNNNSGAPVDSTTPAHTAYMPHINSWSDSRPQNNPGSI